MWTPAVSPIHSPLSERGKDEADKSLEDQDELTVGGSGKGEVDGVDESSLEICHKHEKSCRLAERELARVGIKCRIIEVKVIFLTCDMNLDLFFLNILGSSKILYCLFYSWVMAPITVVHNTNAKKVKKI